MSDNEPQLKDLVNELCDIAFKWMDIGVQLNLTLGQLEVIGAQNDSIHGKLRSMLILWLKQVDPRPTWQRLVAALRTQAVDQEGLAAKLENKYPIPVPPPNNDTCRIHKDRELELYCMTCEEVVTLCFKCALELHKGHTLELFTTAFTKYQSKDMSPLNSDLEKVKETIVQLEKRREQVFDQQAAIEAQISKTTRELQEALEARKKELTRSLHKVTKDKLGGLAAQMKQVVEIRDELSRQQSELTQVLSEVSPKESMIKGQDVVKKTKVVMKKFKPEDFESADVKFSVSPTFTECCQGFGKLTFQEVCPKKCTVNGDGLKMAVLGQTATVMLHCANEQGEQCNQLHQIGCTLVPDGGRLAEQIDCSIKQVQPNKWQISYQSTTRGRHQLHIKVEGEHIKGSPFPVMVIRNIDRPIQAIRNVTAPWGIALDQRENTFVVSESEGHRILVFNRQSGELLRAFGENGSKYGQFEYAHGVAVDDRGNILAVDNSNHRIQKFTADGDFIIAVGELGKPTGKFHHPRGIAIHPQNKMVYIADTLNHRIQILHADLTAHGSFGSHGSQDGQLNEPYDVAVDSNGDVYVTDNENKRIQVFTAEGQYLRQFGQKNQDGTPLAYTRGITIGSDNIVYVTEHNRRSDYVSMYTTQGRFLKSFGTLKRETNLFSGYHGIAMDKNGIVYVCDENHSCIYLY